MSPDEYFAVIDEQRTRTGFLFRHHGRHITPLTIEEAQATIRSQGHGKDYDGKRLVAGGPNDRPCTMCGKPKDHKQHSSRCLACNRAYHRERRARHKEASA